MVEWLIQSSAAHSALARGIAPAGLLSPAEQRCMAELVFEKRRRDWLLGRWAAKRLLQRYLAQHAGQRAPLDALEIASAPDGSPFVRLCEEAGWSAVSSKQLAVIPPTADCLLLTAYCAKDLQTAIAPLCISISHSGGLALCALAAGHTPIGADIEQIAPRGAQFAADYFTPGELAQLHTACPAAHDALAALIWSAKEAALKALRLGLTVDTREVAIELDWPATPGLAWASLRAHYRPRGAGASCELHGWWRVAGGFVMTMALTQAPSCP